MNLMAIGYCILYFYYDHNIIIIIIIDIIMVVYLLTKPMTISKWIWWKLVMVIRIYYYF